MGESGDAETGGGFAEEVAAVGEELGFEKGVHGKGILEANLLTLNKDETGNTKFKIRDYSLVRASSVLRRERMVEVREAWVRWSIFSGIGCSPMARSALRSSGSFSKWIRDFSYMEVMIFDSSAVGLRAVMIWKAAWSGLTGSISWAR